MKQLLVLLFSAVLFHACEKDDQITGTYIIGKWELTEVLADPGDGSGTFQSVNSNKIIEFHTDGTISSNGSICDMSLEANEASIGTYSLEDYTISPAGCSYSPLKITFEFQNSYLILNYPCIEPCRAKYKKR
jgi:hypothetical protein